MKKSILVVAISFLFSASAYAADFGIGVDVNEGSNTISIPINVSEGFRIEPYFSNYKSTQGNDYNGRQSEIGVGLFKVSRLSDKTSWLLGARASYSERHFYEDELEGYSFAPVLGFEYFPIENVSLGADVSYVYSELDGANKFTEDFTSSGTKTTLGIKFYFN